MTKQTIGYLVVNTNGWNVKSGEIMHLTHPQVIYKANGKEDEI